MTTATLTTFFALAAMCAGAAAVLGVLILVLSRWKPWAAGLVRDFGSAGLGLGALAAGSATLGSLWFSEVVGYAPCALCWVQRIFMYSLAIILTIAAIRRDVGAWVYGVVLATAGLGVSAWHTWVQAVGATTSVCTLEAPCAERYVWEFGFVSLPLMAGCVFAFVIVAMVATAVARRPSRFQLAPTSGPDFQQETP